MSTNRIRALVIALGAASLACAPAPHMGDAVDIAEESAIVIWDEAAKTQHFIRRASFRTEAKDFGFLVPTPAVPELAEADNRAFEFLEKLTAPRTVTRYISPNARSEAPMALAAPRVTVLASAKVAGYDAVVLEANNAAALNDWLGRHGYASSPDLVEWFKPYIERNWKISAFKIDRDPQSAHAAASGTVRMSFKTDAPFFPYREPASQRVPGKAEPRLLRAYVLAATRVDGTLGGAGNWPGKAVWANQITEKDRETLLAHSKLPAGTAAGALWLTEFEDGSTPRPGTDDVFFRASQAGGTVERPPVVHYVRSDKWNLEDYLYLGFVALLLSGFLYVAYRVVRGAVRVLRK